jgi:hypothetical protein
MIGGGGKIGGELFTEGVGVGGREGRVGQDDDLVIVLVFFEGSGEGN